MMPYLLDLPPLDSDNNKVTITELSTKEDVAVKTKTSSKKKVPQKEVETEKWHQITKNNDLIDPSKAQTIHINDTNSNKTNCDSNKKNVYDFTISKLQKFISLTDRDMEIFRKLSQKIKK